MKYKGKELIEMSPEKCYPYNVNGIDLTRVYRTHSYYRNNENSPCAKSILIRYIGTNL